MKRVKQLKRWGIYQLNEKERKDYGFGFAVIHPDNMECYSSFDPSDTDIECETLQQAVDWVNLY